MRALLVILLLTACAKIPEPEAVLTTAIGAVTVDGKTATSGMALYSGATINTGTDGLAVITLLKGSALRLDSNSTITLRTIGKEATTVTQTTGRSWTRLTRFGKPDRYTIETPYTVATVRGTAFGVTVDEEHALIQVADGTVTTSTDDETSIVGEGAQLDADEDGTHIEALQEDEWVEENEAADDAFIEQAAEEYITENAEEYEGTMEELDITQEEMHEWVEAWGEGDAEQPVPESHEEVEQLIEEEHTDDAETAPIVDEHVVEIGANDAGDSDSTTDAVDEHTPSDSETDEPVEDAEQADAADNLPEHDGTITDLSACETTAIAGIAF